MLIYLHIPKCGGTSVLEVLSGIYGPYSKSINSVGVWWAGNEQVWNAGSLNGVKCILGHLSYGIHPDLNFVFGSERKLHQYATMLRHPVDRVISMFYYKRRLEGGGFEPFEKMGFSKETTLAEYIEAGKDKALFNAQTAQLSGIVLDKTFVPCRAPDRDDFRIARNNLENITVGVLEHFEASLRLFANRFDWLFVPRPIIENAIKHPPVQAHDPRIIDLIYEQNEFDLLLWDMAKEKLLTK